MTHDNSHLQLAITTIGDLLLRQTISRGSDGQPMKGISLKIPNYQRPYKWNATNAIQLLDDIQDAMSANKETYRVGTLILHHSADNCYNIVDGQQRTITFCLLIRALGEKRPIAFLSEKLTNDDHGHHSVRDNYRALCARTRQMASAERESLLGYIKEQCELIVVITDDIAPAFQFFDSQNARGKKLYPHDLLKAYHLREMEGCTEAETEAVVTTWESIDQKNLASLFSDYLYRVREWMRGNRAWGLSEHNISKFKGVTRRDNAPYAQYCKSAYSYAEMVNSSAVPFVMGAQQLSAFQLDAPIVAGKPFFLYAKHYYDILADIKDNSKYVGCFINDNTIVKTLDQRKYKYGVGNGIARLMFDVAALLYVDRFCSMEPTKADIRLFDRFVTYGFFWAYSLRAQYYNLGWQSAQNYILGNSDKVNSFNIYKMISESPSPTALLNELTERIKPLRQSVVKASTDGIDEPQNYLYFFKENNLFIPSK